MKKDTTSASEKGFEEMIQQETSLMTGSNNPERSYCSVKAVTDDEKIALYNAINGDSEGKRVQDMVNMEIEVADVIFELVELTNEKTGEIEDAPRAILISPEGEAYNATSFGVLSSIQKCIKIFGEPTWSPAKKFIIKQPKTKNGTMLKLEMVTSKKK